MLRHTHIAIFCDNKSTVHWTYKLNSRASIIAQHLLRALGLRQHQHQASPLACISIAGVNNTMANVASCSFINPAFHNKPFHTTFAVLFPLPQNDSWHKFCLMTKLISPVISCLHGQSLTMELWTKHPKCTRSTGDTGLWQPFKRPLNWLENKAQSTKQRAHTLSQWRRLWRAGADPTQQHPPHN